MANESDNLAVPPAPPPVAGVGGVTHAPSTPTAMMPRRVIIDVIEHSAMRYPTVGDYFWEGEDLRIVVSRTKTPVFAWFVAIHELIEVVLASHAGIAEPDIAAFDVQWEAEAAAGKHDMESEEPGGDPRCPICSQHTTAENCERLIVQAAGFNWDHGYAPEITQLWNTTRIKPSRAEKDRP